jgi:hypothetical protein
MLPAAYATPVAVVLVVGGLLACFAGYRLFRFVLGIYGFILGAMITTSIIGAGSIWTLSVAAVVGGLLGAALMIAAYFIGVGLVGAGLAALAMHLVWGVFDREVPTIVLVIGCVLGALGALSVVRYVVVAGTAITGAWTLLVGALALAGDPAALRAASARDVWVFYPLDPLPDRWWVPAAWVVIALVGVVVQLKTTTKGGGRKKKADS